MPSPSSSTTALVRPALTPHSTPVAVPSSEAFTAGRRPRDARTSPQQTRVAVAARAGGARAHARQPGGTPGQPEEEGGLQRLRVRGRRRLLLLEHGPEREQERRGERQDRFHGATLVRGAGGATLVRGEKRGTQREGE